MARQENVNSIIAAIGTIYRNCGSKRPSKAEIIAESGVAHKTFYRVLQDHPEVRRQLELAEAVFDHRPPKETSEVNSDPLMANPRAAIFELLDTIAKLTEIVESQRKWIRILEKQIRTAPAVLTDASTRPSRQRLRYKIRQSQGLIR